MVQMLLGGVLEVLLRCCREVTAAEKKRKNQVTLEAA
jgi:hypothetical protein